MTPQPQRESSANEPVISDVTVTPVREGTKPTPPRLALAPAHGEDLSGLLGRLAKAYFLDVNGTSLLTRCAAMEMKLVSVMLTINFLFDLAVWTMLWNMILYQGKLTIGLWSPVAFFCGFLFAAIILVYERQFMTADTYKRSLKVLWPVSLRLCVVAIAAAVTTQPFEVLVFKGPIQRRAHEESVRREAIRQLRSLEETKAKLLPENLKQTIEGVNAATANQDVEKANLELRKHKDEVNVARADIQRAEAAIRSAQQQRAAARTSAAAAAASRRLASAQTQRNSADNALRQAQAAVGTSSEEVETRKGKAQSSDETLIGKQKEFEAAENRLRDWVKQIGRAEPGEWVEENTNLSPKLTFQDMDYDFFQRLNVINDLYGGRPARWFDASPEDREKVAKLFAISDASENDSLNQQRRSAESHSFAQSYWAVICIALVIPLLLLALKGLLPIDLKRYYSRKAQQEAGNYEALRFVSRGDVLTATYERPGDHQNGARQRYL